MDKLKIIPIVIILILAGFGIFAYLNREQKSNLQGDEGGLREKLNPLSIEALRAGDYPGSDIAIEQTLTPGSNYQRYIASYKSEGLKIYALLTVPDGDPSTGSGQGKPKIGWPVIVFNHGFIPPLEYRTTERYIVYTDAFSRNGYIVFKSDYSSCYLGCAHKVFRNS